ncbi:MAG: hypothetical protein HFG25_06570 [Lachnospiraceae bacterium]|jgi:hypothetical protein|nr:hypothetical protein [Lachnospiraceae bacterium]
MYNGPWLLSGAMVFFRLVEVFGGLPGMRILQGFPLPVTRELEMEG